MPSRMRSAWVRVGVLLSVLAVLFAGNPGIAVRANPAPTLIRAQGYQNAIVTFVGNQVRLTLNGATAVVATDNPKRLNPMFSELASISPDGTKLLYVTGDGESMRNAAFTEVDFGTMQKRTIARVGNSLWIHKPLWSPNSQQILYVLQNPTTFAPEVWVISAMGGNQRLVVTGGALTHISLEGYEAKAPQWSSDGASIVFYDNAFKPTTRWIVSLATGTRTLQHMPNLCVGPTTKNIVPNCGGGGGICYVPIYYQNNQSYSNNIMRPIGDTIGNAGCALTSLTMLFDYNGSTVGNPGGMNNCLSPWNDAEPLSWYGAQVNPPNGPGCDKFTTNWIQQVGFSWSTLDSYLRSGWPVIMGGCWDAPTCNQTHWVVVTGGNGTDNYSSYSINDPWQGEASTMSGLTSRGFTFEWMSLYQRASGTGSPCE